MVPLQAIPGLFEKLEAVLVRQVAETPLDPDAVIFGFEFKLLQALLVELPHFRNLFPSLGKQSGCWLEKVYIFESLEQGFSGDAADSSAAINGAVEAGDAVFKLFNHLLAGVAVTGVN